VPLVCLESRPPLLGQEGPLQAQVHRSRLLIQQALSAPGDQESQFRASQDFQALQQRRASLEFRGFHWLPVSLSSRWRPGSQVARAALAGLDSSPGLVDSPDSQTHNSGAADSIARAGGSILARGADSKSESAGGSIPKSQSTHRTLGSGS